MKSYYIFFFIFLVFIGGLLLKFGLPDFVSFFAKAFNPPISESELKQKILGLEELLASITRQKIFPIKEDGDSAEIIGYLLGSGGKKIFIDKGALNGVKPGDWILAGDKTLFGIIEKVEEKFSIVKTIFDPSLKVASRVVGSQETSSTAVFNGVFYFDGSGFTIDFLSREAEDLAGSFVESSGRDGIFRSGFYLGRVISFGQSSEPNLKKAQVEFPLEVQDIRTVKIVKNFLAE